MARESEIILRYGTRAALDIAAAANDLLKGEPFLLEDEARFGVALSASTYQTFLKTGEVSAGLSGTVMLNLPSGAGVLEWTESEVVPGIGAGQPVFLALAGVDASAENDPECLDLKMLSGLAGAGTITITATFTERTSGPVAVNWSV